MTGRRRTLSHLAHCEYDRFTHMASTATSISRRHDESRPIRAALHISPLLLDHNNHTTSLPRTSTTTSTGSARLLLLVRLVVRTAAEDESARMVPTFLFFDRRGPNEQCLGKDTSPSKYSLKRPKLQQSTVGSPTNICCSSYSSLVVSHTTARRHVRGHKSFGFWCRSASQHHHFHGSRPDNDRPHHTTPQLLKNGRNPPQMTNGVNPPQMTNGGHT